MIVPDANLLLYAQDSSSPFHVPARRWWERCLSGTEPVGLTHPVLFAFLRIATSTRAFVNPLSLEEASRHMSRWLDRRITTILRPDDTHVARVLELLTAASSAGGNLVTDAQIASLAIAHRGTVHTADNDFLRFNDLTTHYPLKGT